MSKDIETLKLYSSIKKLIDESRHQTALTVNSALTTLYWQIGKQVNDEILKHKRAEFGKQIVAILAEHLASDYGTGWSEKQLRHCIRFAGVFPDEQIVSALRRELSWTHFRTIIFIEDALKREFYIELCKLEKWSTRRLHERINSMLYERTLISKKPDKTIKNELEQLKNEDQISEYPVFHDSILESYASSSKHHTRVILSPIGYCLQLSRAQII